MVREEAHQGRWSFPRWRVVGVIAGEKKTSPEITRRLVHCEGARRQYIWGGFTLKLSRDSSESYWYNLVGKTPSLFVICRADEQEGSMTPFLVTADHDEANAHMEADDAVFSVDIPPEVYQWLERYVVENYRPQERKTRKRNNWSAECKYEKPQTPQPD